MSEFSKVHSFNGYEYFEDLNLFIFHVKESEFSEETFDKIKIALSEISHTGADVVLLGETFGD